MRNILFAGLLAGALGHVCILHPKQRGKLSIDMPGDDSCYRRTDYCGGVPIEKPAHQFLAGSYAHILFQQNLNHWVPAKQGFMELALSKDSSPSQPDDWRLLTTVPDWPGYEMVRQTNFSVEVVIPPEACDHCILRLKYVSYNKMEIDPPNNTDAIFYNCADVQIVSSSLPLQTPPPAPLAQPAVGNNSANVKDGSCSTPPVWSMVCAEATPLGFVSHRIWWNSVKQLTRWDQSGNLWSATTQDTLVAINNYTAPLEYVNFITSLKKCFIYGNDALYPWSYGASNGQTYEGRIGSLDTWSRAGGFSWVTQDLGDGLCKPVGWTRGAGYSATCANFGTSSIPDDIFIPDPKCLHNPEFRGCRAAQVKALWDLSH
jgi:hypothetical protein